MICGSMTFSKEMSATKKKLEKLGHKVSLPYDIDVHLKDDTFIDDLEKDFEHCVKLEVLRKCFEQVAQNQAILVLNYPKNGVKGYIGTSSLMEIGLAYYLRKKIFLMYDTPTPDQARWAHEVRITQPVIINGDLGKI